MVTCFYIFRNFSSFHTPFLSYQYSLKDLISLHPYQHLALYVIWIVAPQGFKTQIPRVRFGPRFC